MTYVVDTHALVWFLEKNRRLSPAARAAMKDPTAELVIPTIALAEIAHLYPRKRIRVDLSGVFTHVAAASNCIIYPLDEAVVERLPAALSIHDAIITATALVLREALDPDTSVITRDAEIRTSGLVRVVW
ncbi:MAG: type II toxin-antitoxin system VapC family toxin [Planctomycetes bacterium]|nr:type II toxin-antitoxin system VapC family toxin [Planctomycetota bacterium]